MKKIPLRRGFGRFLAALSCPFLSTGAAAGAEKPEPARSHVLFMGADLAVPREKKYYRVQDVVGSEFMIKVGQKEFFVPTRSRSAELKVSHSLKLSGASVTLDDLHDGPTYTTANDPVRKMIAASGAAGGAAATQDLAFGRMIQASVDVGATVVGVEGDPRATDASIEAGTAVGRANYDALATVAEGISAMTQYSSQSDTGAYANQMHNELAAGNHDAMEVSFKISSPVELDDPHMVILFRFRERDAKPGEEGMLIHAKSLEPIGPKSKYIRVRETGLPAGFKYVGCTVHIYNRGQELATNVSPKRVELTREEAQQYVVIEHIGTNKGATVPAVAVAGSLSPDRLRGLAPAQLNRTYYAKISKDGVLLGVFADEVCHQPWTDPAVNLMLADSLFKPTLLNGKPVDGVARIRLADLAR